MKTKKAFIFSWRYIFVYLFAGCIVFHICFFLIDVNEFFRRIGIGGADGAGKTNEIGETGETNETGEIIPDANTWIDNLWEWIRENDTILSILTPIILFFIYHFIIKPRLDNWRKKRNDLKKRRAEEKRFNEYLEECKSQMASDNSTFNLPFCKSKKFPMESAFIKLMAKERKENSKDSEDLLKIIIKNERLIITGAPGAGKSLMCKKIMHLVGNKRDEHLKDTIPVLIELGSYDSSTKSSIKNYIPKPPNGCDNLLEEQFVKGKVLFLLDGFDEISNKEQCRKIKNEILILMTQYPRCRYIITCRDEVYDEEFKEKIKTEYKINDFNENQIKKYIKVWTELTNETNKNSKEIYKTLQEKSHLMELAHNPLMLAMILYLHVDNNRPLPRSRGEFYTLLTEVLLCPEATKKYADIKYKWDYKNLINLLSHIAWNMDDDGVGVTINQDKIKELIKKLNSEEREKNLIIEDLRNSSLILRIKGKESVGDAIYKFSHKTIKEYFTAHYARENNVEDLLLKKFEEDEKPSRWKKTIRLYCNIYKGDISNTLEKINKIKGDIALECLAEIKTDIANENDILSKFISTDSKSNWKNDANGKDYVIKALGLIISGYHDKGVIQQRAKKVFEYIQSLLVKDFGQDDMEEIAEVLANSHIREAVEILVEHSEKDIFFNALKGIKEVREFHLTNIAKENNNEEAVNCLYKIGDNEAYKDGLLTLIWDDNSISSYAAKLLSTKDSRKKLMEILKDIKKEKVDCKDVPILEEVWEPFDKSKNTYLYYVMCRIAYLVSKNTDMPANHKIDSRLAIPLAIEKYFPKKEKHLIFSQMDEGEELYETLKKRKEKTLSFWKECWYNVLNKSLYNFKTSKEFLYIAIIIVIFLVVSISSLVYYSAINNSNAAICVMLLFIFLMLLLLIYDGIADESYSSKYNKYGFKSIGELSIVLVISFLLLIYSLGINIYRKLPEFIIFLAYDVLMLVLMLAVLSARFKKQKAKNPLSDFKIKEE